jgi:phage recombination protein Bet
MSTDTATATKTNGKAFKEPEAAQLPAAPKNKPPLQERAVRYVPLGAVEEIELKYEHVVSFLVEPTRSGAMPPSSDIIKFMKLCQARLLDPWQGDAFLVGYDSQEGPKFSLITAAQALAKRAELHPEFNGILSGIIVTRGDQIIEREGSFYIPGDEVVVGGWAKVYRKDRDTVFFSSMPLSVYSTGRSRWKVDPGGMIQKVAEASAYRKAFPNQLAQLYLREEFAATLEGRLPAPSQPALPSKPKTLSEVSKQLTDRGLVEPPTEPTEPEDSEGSLKVVQQYMLEIESCNSQEGADSIWADVKNDASLSEDQRKKVLDLLTAKMG